jgi:sulfite reductase (ferredoxin)
VRTTVDQNIVLRWISQADLPDVYTDLVQAGLAQAGASTLVDITACPGTDTCKLGISSSRGLAAELRQRISSRNFQLEEAVKNLTIKISGCFNSCGQHHVADIGFYGVSRKVGNHAVPHFQVVLGGQWTENAGAYGLATVAVPSKRIPDAVERITDLFVQEREPGESFQAFVKRTGKARMRSLLEDLTQVPDYMEDRSFYSDWGDPREYSLGDMGIGECAGEVVSLTQFGLAASERKVFEAQLHLDNGEAVQAGQVAYEAMLQAAKALIQHYNIDVSEDPEKIIEEFRIRFYDTELFFDPFAGAKFAHYLFRMLEEGQADTRASVVRQRIEEAQLFIEAAHGCYNRMGPQPLQILV